MTNTITHGKRINARISILASYEDTITISVYDNDAAKTFMVLELTREQFINAAMNRQGLVEVRSATVQHLDKLGKKQVIGTHEFRISKYGDADEAQRLVKKNCPEGWTPDLSFSSQDSFFVDIDRNNWAKTIIRKWVDIQ